MEKNNISLIYGGKQAVPNCPITLLKDSWRNSLIKKIICFPNLIRETFKYILTISEQCLKLASNIFNN